MLRTFGRRRWLAAAAGTAGSLIVLGLPTDLVPNPIFGRQIEAPAWSYAALVVTSVLAGLLLDDLRPRPARRGRGAPRRASRR